MSRAAVNFRQFAPPPGPSGTSAPEFGVYAFAPLVPLGEPLSVGVPPIAPDLVRRLATGLPVRVVESEAGIVHTVPVDVAARPRVSVAWSGLTLARRNTLRTWLVGAVLGGVMAFDLEPDGPGSGALRVRLTGAWTETERELGSIAAGGVGNPGPGVFDIAADCEEILL